MKVINILHARYGGTLFLRNQYTEAKNLNAIIVFLCIIMFIGIILKCSSFMPTARKYVIYSAIGGP